MALTGPQVLAEYNSAVPVLNMLYYDNSNVGLYRNWRLAGVTDLTDTVDDTVLTLTGTGVTDEDGP